MYMGRSVCLELICRTIGFAILLKTDRDMIDRNVIQLKAHMRFGNRKVLRDHPIGTWQTPKRLVWNDTPTNRIESLTPAVIHDSAPGFHF